MTYGNIYELMEYLKKHNIVLSDDFKEEVLTSKLEPKYFEILHESKKIIRLFLYPSPEQDKFEFIMKMKNIISFRHLRKKVALCEEYKKYGVYESWLKLLKHSNILEDKEVLRLIVKQDFGEIMELQQACENPQILENREALKLISRQNNWKKIEQLRLAYENPLVDEEILKLIAKQKDWLQMQELRFACENPRILANKELFMLIARQRDWTKMEQLRLAYENPLVDKEIFGLIAKQKDWFQMCELRLACESSQILADKEALQLIVSQSNWQKMKQLRLACESSQILADKEALQLIAAQSNWQKMEQLRLACEYSKILKDREALYTMANFENVLKMQQFRIYYIFSCEKTSNSLSNQVMSENSAPSQDNSNCKIRDQKRFNYHVKKSILSQIKIANDLLQQESALENNVSILNNSLIKDLEYNPELLNKKKK